MKPKEKAKKLIDKYYDLTDECNCLEYSCICFTMWDFKAKQCALIAIDEILTTLNFSDIKDYSTDLRYYWEEVKQEIENYKS